MIRCVNSRCLSVESRNQGHQEPLPNPQKSQFSPHANPRTNQIRRPHLPNPPTTCPQITPDRLQFLLRATKRPALSGLHPTTTRDPRLSRIVPPQLFRRRRHRRRHRILSKSGTQALAPGEMVVGVHVTAEHQTHPHSLDRRDPEPAPDLNRG